MAVTDPGNARDEAERLVAAALAAASMAAQGLGGQDETRERFATGSDECCVCPVCRAIAAVRDPSPEFAERLATGAGDLAAGLASMLRSFTAAGPQTQWSHQEEPAPGSNVDPDSVWRTATREEPAGTSGHPSGAATPPAAGSPVPKPMAKKAVKKAADRVPPADGTPAGEATDEGSG